MKGQFFIIGALMVCIAMFFGLPPEIGIASTYSDDMAAAGGNLGAELPHAMNLGINGSGAVPTLVNFTSYAKQTLAARRMSIESFWVVFESEGSTLNVTVGNFLGSERTFYIDVSGSPVAMTAGDGQTNSTILSVSGPVLNVTVSAGGSERAFVIPAGKSSLYSEVTLRRGGDAARKEILA